MYWRLLRLCCPSFPAFTHEAHSFIDRIDPSSCVQSLFISVLSVSGATDGHLAPDNHDCADHDLLSFAAVLLPCSPPLAAPWYRSCGCQRRPFCFLLSHSSFGKHPGSVRPCHGRLPYRIGFDGMAVSERAWDRRGAG